MYHDIFWSLYRALWRAIGGYISHLASIFYRLLQSSWQQSRACARATGASLVIRPSPLLTLTRVSSWILIFLGCSFDNCHANSVISMYFFLGKAVFRCNTFGQSTFDQHSQNINRWKIVDFYYKIVLYFASLHVLL